LIRVFLISLVFLFVGCGVKTPLASIEQENMRNNAIIMGSLSRDSGKAYYRAMSFYVTDLNDDYITSVVNQGKENLSSLSNPFEFEDDFEYENSKGSVFVVSLPAGSYRLQKFYIGSGPKGFNGKYQKKITVKNGEVIYIGDIHSVPILKDNPFYDNVKMANGAKFVIRNKLERDYQVFQKKYKGKFFKKEQILINVEEGSFKLGNFEDNTNYQLMLPPL